jgi:hypothetical protein
MQQIGQVLFLLGFFFAFAAGIGFEHLWLPVGPAVFGVFVGAALLVVAMRLLFRTALSTLWKTNLKEIE